jgi:hypothetical protein
MHVAPRPQGAPGARHEGVAAARAAIPTSPSASRSPVRSVPSTKAATPPQAQPSADSPPAPPPPTVEAAGAHAQAGLPSRDELTLAWGDSVLGSLPPRARSRFAAGRFMSVEDGHALFGLPNSMHRKRCEELKADVEAALSAHFGRPVPLRLVVDTGASALEPSEDEEEIVDLDGLQQADPALTSPEDRLKQAFPGAEEVR